MATKLLYMEHPKMFEHDATIASISDADDGRKIIIVNETCFSPQGGGSPFDTGKMTSNSGAFDVQEVRFVEGDVHHVGIFEDGSFAVGDAVHLAINVERREMICKLQSAGHLIDMAMREIGYTDFIPTKGFHFPEGPSVEYKGLIEPEKKDAVMEKLQDTLDKMIEQDYEVKIKMSNKEEAEKICYFVPQNLPENKPIRVVAVWKDLYMPCGAAHVERISELKGLKVTKLKSKKGSTRVGYMIS